MSASITGIVLDYRLADPGPPHGHEQAGRAREVGQGAVVLQGVDDLGDRDDEHQVEEQLEPGRVPLILVGVDGPQLGRPQPPPPCGRRHQLLHLHDYRPLARSEHRPPARHSPPVRDRPAGPGGSVVRGGPGNSERPGRRPLVGVEPMWAPSPERVERANMTRYLRWLGDQRGLRFASYDELWRWSVDDLDGFWTSIWEFFEVGGPTPSPALAERRMPGARWFPGATLNLAELSLRRHDDHPALLAGNEAGELETIGHAELGRRVAAAAAGLRRLGVAKGDRVVAYLPNVPETVIAMLATASIGAIWSSCAPEFGVSSVVDRFAQIEPKVLVAVDGYRYN